MRKTFRYRLYPTKAQAQILTHQLREACTLYNAALEERRIAWKVAGKSISYYDQARQLKEIRGEGLTGLVSSACSQNVLRQLDKAFSAFYRRVMRGQKPGYPRFKAHQRFNSITFPEYGSGVRFMPSGKLRVLGVGMLKVKLHRPVEGQIKTVTLRREAGKWYVCFSVIMDAVSLAPSQFAIGIDVGLESFAVFSDGQVIANPRHYKRARRALIRAHRKVSRRKKGSNRRAKARRELQVAYAKVRNQRQDFQHKLAYQLVQTYGLIAIEALNLKGLISGMLAIPVRDAAWGDFFSKLTYKAESAGRLLVRVNSRGTSQRCSGCGAEVRKKLRDRWHSCTSCGLSVSRDLNSAQEILRLGLSLVDSTWGSSPCVSTEAIALELME